MSIKFVESKNKWVLIGHDSENRQRKAYFSNESDAITALNSYNSGEYFKNNKTRHKKRVTISSKPLKSSNCYMVTYIDDTGKKHYRSFRTHTEAENAYNLLLTMMPN